MNIWSRLGVSVALAAIFCIAATELLQSKVFYELYKWHICIALMLCGAILWLVGRSLNARFARKNPPVEQPQPQSGEEGEVSDDGQPFLLINLAYWGAMLIVFGIIIVFITPLRAVQTVAARTNSIPVAARQIVPTNLPP